MELNALALETLITIRIEGKLLKDYTPEEINAWGNRIGLSQEYIDIYKETIIQLNNQLL